MFQYITDRHIIPKPVVFILLLKAFTLTRTAEAIYHKQAQINVKLAPVTCIFPEEFLMTLWKDHSHLNTWSLLDATSHKGLKPASIWGLWCQRQVSQAGISNDIPQFIVGCNYLSLREIPASGAKVLVYSCKVHYLLISHEISIACYFSLSLHIHFDILHGARQ